MYAQLGEIQFDGLIGFDSLDQASSANFAEHAVIQGKPRLQKVGDNLDEVKASFSLHSRFCVPEDEIAKLRTAMNDGEVLPFVTGAGDVIGSFVITDLAVKPDQTDKDGKYISVSVDVTLKEFYDPALAKRKEKEAKASGFAAAQNEPVISVAPIPPQSLTASSAADIAGCITDAASVEGEIGKISDNPADESAFQRCESALSSMKDKTDSAIEKLNQMTGDLYTNTRDLVSDLTDMIGTIEDLQTAVGLRDAILSVTGFDALSISVSNVRKTNAVLVGFAAARR